MRKTAALTHILALLFSVVVGTPFANLAEANPLPAPLISQIYIRSDGTVDPSTAPIQRAGNIYTFTSDLTNSTIIVQCNNIVIDGAGYKLQGSGNWWHTDRGITLTNRSNVVIKNIDIRNYVQSIALTASSNIIVYGNNMLTGWNILLDSSIGNQIIGNNITAQDSYYCIRVENGAANNLIMGNNFYDAGEAVTVYSSSGKNNTFYHNNFVDNHYNVVGWIGYEEANFWDNGTEGNFWSDYEGIDVDGDGIGDTPYIMSSYIIDDYRQDSHPLMAPFDINGITVELPEWANTSDLAEPFPTALLIGSIIAVVAVVVGLGLLVYHKKRRMVKKS